MTTTAQGYRVEMIAPGRWALFAHRPLESDAIDGWDEIEDGFPSATQALAVAMEMHSTTEGG